MGSRDGIEAEEKSVIDRCLPLVYQKYFADPKPENMPVLGDLYDCLRAQKEPQAQRIATALEIYVNGSLKVFNHRTNVELNNRIVCFDIKELGKQLKKIGMLIVQDQVWNRVTINRGIKSTRYYIDEFHLLLKEDTAVKKSKKLLQFVLDDGTGTDRIILSGVHAFYEPEELEGKTLLAIVNLPPRKMMGIESCGMLLSAIHNVNGEEQLNLVMLNDAIPAGAKLY